jgi:cobalt-zinc-cadmium resistance protein CzcA
LEIRFPVAAGKVEVKMVPNQIQRENAQRRIVVGFNIKGEMYRASWKNCKVKWIKEMKLPTGYYMTYGGSFENLNNAKQRLMIAVPIALALIFVMLFFAFKSVKESLLIYTAIPLSIIGGVFLWLLRNAFQHQCRSWFYCPFRSGGSEWNCFDFRI